MSKIALTPNASGTGTFTLASPNSSTSRTLTLPDTTGELLNDASSLASGKLTGALPAIDGSSLTGMLSGFSAKAWATFVGVGTVSITDDGNVSSLTDSGVGRYTLAFTTALSSANYATCAIGKDNSTSTADGGRPKVFMVKGFTDTPSLTTGEMVVAAQGNTVNEVDSPLVCCTWTT
tara:strand:+ start:3186 stop:3716 length:531 start_codon:yes stop_codon:yes gene_type:complete